MPFSPDLAPLRPVPETAPAVPAVPAALSRHHLSGQALRFLAVGGVATVVDIGLFNVLHFGLGVGPLSAKVASTVVAGIVAFVGNRELTFHKQDGTSVRTQALAFTAVSLAALLLNLLPLAVTRYGFGLTGALSLNIAANGVGLALATAFRFYGCRRWVFPVAQERVIDLSDLPEAERLAA